MQKKVASTPISNSDSDQDGHSTGPTTYDVHYSVGGLISDRLAIAFFDTTARKRQG
jgi:hypothetical protein